MHIVYSIVKGLAWMLGRLPLGYHYFWGKVIAWLLRDVLHYRKDVVMTNIARSFPNMKYKDVKAVCRKSYDHLGEILAEAVWFGASDSKRISRSGIVDVENLDQVLEGYQKNGAVVLTSHCGNWELIGGILSHWTDPEILDPAKVKVVYKALRNKFWDRFFIENRTAPVGSTEYAIESSNVLRYAVSHRHEKMLFVFPTDQSPYRNATVHRVKDFMHQRTITMTGGAALARSLHMSVYIMGMRIESKGHYVVSFDQICEDGSLFTPEQIMDLYYEKLQKQIEAQPWNYLWTHKRWKNNEHDFKDELI